jgi:hypothetical protein
LQHEQASFAHLLAAGFEQLPEQRGDVDGLVRGRAEARQLGEAPERLLHAPHVLRRPLREARPELGIRPALGQQLRKSPDPREGTAQLVRERGRQRPQSGAVRPPRRGRLGRRRARPAAA